MKRWHAFRQLVLARIREFYREPEAIFWVYGFPLLLAVGLGIAFKGDAPEPPAVDVQSQPLHERAEEIASLLREQGLTVELLPAKECETRLTQGKTSLFL